MQTQRPTIGMLIDSLVESHQAQWLGAVDAARAFQANLITFVGRELESPHDFKAQANAIYELVDGERLDGLIVWTTSLQLYVGGHAMEQLCRRFGPVPLVSVEQSLGDHPTLLMENRRGMYDVVSHLVEAHGHRRIAFARGPANHLGAQDRYEGYLDALADHGLPADPTLISPLPHSWYQEEPAAWVGGLLDRHASLDAIAAVNDSTAVAVVGALDARGVRVPEDIAVTGFDDVIGIYSVVDPPHRDLRAGRPATDGDALEQVVNVMATALPLTTVRAPFYEMGWRAAELLLAKLRNEPVPDIDSIRTELVVRRSCGCFSSAVQHLGEPAVKIPLERAVSEGYGQSVVAGREQLTASLQQALAMPEAATAAERADRLLAAYRAALEGKPGHPFLQVLDELVRLSMRRGGRVGNWWRVLRALRHSSADLLTDATVDRAEALWLRVQLLMEETAERFSAYQRLVVERRSQLIREIGRTLVTVPDLDKLADVLAEQLPSLQVKTCYLASYEAASMEDGTGEQQWARAILVYEGGRRIGIAADEVRFLSKQLAPEGIVDREEAYSLVALPLYFKEQQLGFVLFEVGPRTGWIYEAVQEQLSSALEGALLIARERHANRLLQQEIGRRENVEAALQRAHDELEERVADRTADLARANEVLSEQIIERERAEAFQARLEAQLRQAQKMEAVGRLAGGIAHDFNNMLVVITGLSELLIADLDEGDPMRPDLEEIRYAGKRAADLTRRLLAFSRRQVLQPSVLNLNDVIANVQTMLRRLIGEDVGLETSLDASLAPVLADEAQIEQLIVNLALNARDAMPGGGRLTIETANADRIEDGDGRHRLGMAAGPHVLLRVRDTGVGMDEETQARLFEPFFTTKPPGRGTGLGLAAVYGIVQQSGGHIDVSSALGEGTTFDIYLPHSTQTMERVSPAAVAPSSLSGSETILLVEDEQGVRRASRRFLEEHGYTVLEAVDGADALRLCERHDGPVDLLITDAVMPGMTGRELVDQMSQIRPDTPVLYFSGYLEGDIPSGLPNEKTPLLQKPFGAEALARKVREILDSTRVR